MYDDIKKMISLLKENKKKVIVNSDAHTISEIGRDEELREKFDYLGLNDDIIINNNKEELLRFLNS